MPRALLPYTQRQSPKYPTLWRWGAVRCSAASRHSRREALLAASLATASLNGYVGTCASSCPADADWPFVGVASAGFEGVLESGCAIPRLPFSSTLQLKKSLDVLVSLVNPYRIHG
jgi:hypothetical protein